MIQVYMRKALHTLLAVVGCVRYKYYTIFVGEFVWFVHNRQDRSTVLFNNCSDMYQGESALSNLYAGAPVRDCIVLNIVYDQRCVKNTVERVWQMQWVLLIVTLKKQIHVYVDSFLPIDWPIEDTSFARENMEKFLIAAGEKVGGEVV